MYIPYHSLNTLSSGTTVEGVWRVMCVEGVCGGCVEGVWRVMCVEGNVCGG